MAGRLQTLPVLSRVCRAFLGVEVPKLPEGGVVRLATPGDYDGITQMSKGLYGGRDYLISHYQDYIQQKNCMIYLMEINKQIAVVAMCLAVDGGRTMVDRALRTAPQVKGHGLVAAFTAPSMCDLWNRYPDVVRHRRLVYTPPGTPPERVARGIYKGWDVKDKKNQFILGNDVPLNTLLAARKHLAKDVTHLPQKLSRNHLSSLMCSPAFMDKIRDAEYLHCAEPVKMSQENLDMLCNQRRQCFWDEETHSLSILELCQTPRGLLVDSWLQDENHIQNDSQQSVVLKRHLAGHWASIHCHHTHGTILPSLFMSATNMLNVSETISHISAMLPRDTNNDSTPSSSVYFVEKKVPWDAPYAKY